MSSRQIEHFGRSAFPAGGQSGHVAQLKATLRGRLQRTDRSTRAWGPPASSVKRTAWAAVALVTFNYGGDTSLPMPSIGRLSALHMRRSVKTPGLEVLPSSIFLIALCESPVERTRSSHVMQRASRAARRYAARGSVPLGGRQTAPEGCAIGV